MIPPKHLSPTACMPQAFTTIVNGKQTNTSLHTKTDGLTTLVPSQESTVLKPQDGIKIKVTGNTPFDPEKGLCFEAALNGALSRKATPAQILSSEYTTKIPKESALGPLDTKEQRLAALKQIVQLDKIKDTKENSDKNRCGAASIVAGALYAGGNQGLIDIAEAIKAYNKSPNVDLTMLDSIIQNIKNGTATSKDIALLQDALYRVLDKQEEMSQVKGQAHNPANQDTAPMLASMSVSLFILESPKVREMFEKEGLRIAYVDTDGQGGGNHFVLKLKDPAGKPAIYDPWPRKSGQIVDEPKQLQAYQDAQEKDFAYPLEFQYGEHSVKIRSAKREGNEWHLEGQITKGEGMGQGVQMRMNVGSDGDFNLHTAKYARSGKPLAP